MIVILVLHRVDDGFYILVDQYERIVFIEGSLSPGAKKVHIMMQQ